MESYSVKAILSAVDQSFSSTIAKAGQQVQQFGNNVGQRMQSVGKAMTAAGAATTAMGIKALKGFGDFQQTLNTTAVVAGGTSKDIGKLSDLANKMGEDLPLSAQEAANAMLEMARNGASLKDIQKQFPAIAKAATAAGSNLQTTAGVVQQAMNIWGDSLKSPQQAAAILVQTANASNASVEDMQQALATIGSTAKMAGMDMGTTAEAIGLLTNRGFSAAQASDDLNHAITQMLAPSSVAKKKMDDLGLSFVDSQGKMKPFPKILQEIAEKTKGMGDSQKTAALKAMFGAAGMKAIAPLLDSMTTKSKSAAKNWWVYAEAQEKAAGSTAKSNKYLSGQSKEMQKNIGASLEQVGGAWESLRNKSMESAKHINGAYLGMIKNAMDYAGKSNSAVAQITRGFIGLSPVIGTGVTALGGFITNFQKITGAAGKTISVLSNVGRVMKAVALAGDMTTAIKALKEMAEGSRVAKAAMIALQGAQKLVRGAQIALNAVMMANPWTLLAVAILAVVAALTWFFTQTQTGRAMWQSFVTWLSGLWQSLLAITQDVWGAITTFIGSIPLKIQALWQGITGFFSNLWTAIVSVAVGIWNSLGQQIGAIADNFKQIWSTAGSFFSGLWSGVVSIALGIWNGFVGGVQGIWSRVKGLFREGVQFIKSVVHVDLFANGKAIMTSLLRGLKSVWEAIKKFIGGIAEWIGKHKGPISYDRKLLIPAGKAIMQGLNNGLIDGFGEVQSNVMGMAGQIQQAVANAQSSYANGFGNLHSTISQSVNGTVKVTTSNPQQSETNYLLRQIAAKDTTMVLDDGTLVGYTAAQYDQRLGQNTALKDRWSR